MVYGDTRHIEHLKDKATVLECDLKERQRVDQIIGEVQPDIVFHLAAQSFVTVSWEDPEETLKTNVLGTFYLLDSIRRGDLSRGEELLSAMDDIYSVLVTMDFPDAIIGGLRRTTDMVRGVLERTRSDLTLVIRQKDLENRLGELEGNLRQSEQD